MSNLVQPSAVFLHAAIAEMYDELTTSDNRHEQSLAGGLFQTSLQLASTVGVCLSSLVQTVVNRRTGSLEEALKDAFWMLAGFAWLCKSTHVLTWFQPGDTQTVAVRSGLTDVAALITAVSLRNVGLAKDVARSRM
jgi:hypothetical protein